MFFRRFRVTLPWRVRRSSGARARGCEEQYLFLPSWVFHFVLYFLSNVSESPPDEVLQAL